MSRDTGEAGASAPLATSLTRFTEKLIADRGAEQSGTLFAGQIDPSVKALATRTNVIDVGDKAPSFSLRMANGGSWSLDDCLARGEADSVVVVFYRGTWCGYCNLYMRHLLEVQSQLSAANAALIAVSPEAEPLSADDPMHIYLRDTLSGEAASTEGASFLFLVDEGGKVAQKFGLAFEMDDAAKDVLRGLGLDVAARNADGRWTLPVPGTFVINRTGKVVCAHVDADYRNRPEPREIVTACQALRS